MKILRTATLIMVCLGLALPSAHALALCIDSEGNLALEVAINGRCTGSKTRSNDRERTDVVLGGGGAAVPPPALSGKHKPSRPTDEAVDPIYAPGNSTPRASGTRCSSSAPVPERPPTCDSVVLRL